jgi:HAD superfamily hydrolase (TIGR01662 family)
MTNKTPKYRAAVFDVDGALWDDRSLDGTAHPGMNDLAYNLKKSGVIVGVITNGDQVIQKNKMETLGLSEYRNVKYFYASDTVGESDFVKDPSKNSSENYVDMVDFIQKNVSKPSTYMFDKFVKDSGIPAHEILYIGDQARPDIQGGINAGFDTYYVACQESGAELLKGAKKSKYVNSNRKTLASDLEDVILGNNDSSLKKAVGKLATFVL